jgi:putative ABC transport system substrate-binding protein
MRRREFLGAMGGMAVWPLTTQAQTNTKPIVGFLGPAAALPMKGWANAFVLRMAERGWKDGETVAIEFRWADGRLDRAVEIAAEFVKQNVNVIVTAGVGPSQAASRATPTIPIVFAINSDPIGSGIIKSLSHPGGNVTGLSIQSSDLAGKRIDLLRQLVPSANKFAILANARDQGAMLQMQSVQDVAASIGITTVPMKVATAADIDAAFASLEGDAKGLFVCADPFALTNRERIFSLAAGAHLPTMADLREFVLAGATMSYGPNVPDLWRRAADYTDKILRGAHPRDLPVQQPTVFDFVVSIANAKRIGLNMPSTLLALANDVIE